MNLAGTFDERFLRREHLCSALRVIFGQGSRLDSDDHDGRGKCHPELAPGANVSVCTSTSVDLLVLNLIPSARALILPSSFGAIVARTKLVTEIGESCGRLFR